MTTSDEGAVPARRRVTLTGISSRAWEHPADRGALTALRELRGFDDVVKAFFGMWNERGFRLSYLASAMRVDHRQYPRVYQLYTEAAQTLDVPELPELFVKQSPVPGRRRRSASTGRSSSSTRPPCSSLTTRNCARCSGTSSATCRAATPSTRRSS